MDLPSARMRKGSTNISSILCIAKTEGSWQEHCIRLVHRTTKRGSIQWPGAETDRPPRAHLTGTERSGRNVNATAPVKMYPQQIICNRQRRLKGIRGPQSFWPSRLANEGSESEGIRETSLKSSNSRGRRFLYETLTHEEMPRIPRLKR